MRHPKHCQLRDFSAPWTPMVQRSQSICWPHNCSVSSSGCPATPLACVVELARYVPPYDRGERHLPGYNWCGPGTNVTRRLRERVQPMNALDRACMEHDMETETRGPARARGNVARMRAADKRLLAQAARIRRSKPSMAADCLIVENAMRFNLATGRSGRGGWRGLN